MTKFDLDEERQRLTRLYRSLSEEELKEIAKDTGSLTDAAREIIGAEVARRGLLVEQDDLRGLIIKPEDASESAEGDTGIKLVTLARFRDMPEAFVAKSILDSAGIECFLEDENTIRMDWLWSNLLGGVKLCVKEEDANTAAELLKQDFSEANKLEDGEELKN